MFLIVGCLDFFFTLAGAILQHDVDNMASALKYKII